MGPTMSEEIDKFRRKLLKKELKLSDGRVLCIPAVIPRAGRPLEMV